MRLIDLEALVVDTVERVVSGGVVEDDHVELKREWPKPDASARQLCGFANGARGRPIVYVIGVDEKAGSVVQPPAQDPASWWDQMKSHFDEDVWPQLLHQVSVPVGDGKSVMALAFATDRAPYLIVSKDGSKRREIPMRDATGTISAARHDVLRMLAPAVLIPPVEVLDGRVAEQWTAEQVVGDGRSIPPALDLSGTTTLFIENVTGDVLVFPAHRMKGELKGGGFVIPLAISAPGHWQIPGSPAPMPKVHGVEMGHDAVRAIGSGQFWVRLSPLEPLDPHFRSRIHEVEEWSLDLQFGLAGADSPVTCCARYTRASPSDFDHGLSIWTVSFTS